jgi:hypothetical protein
MSPDLSSAMPPRDRHRLGWALPVVVAMAAVAVAVTVLAMVVATRQTPAFPVAAATTTPASAESAPGGFEEQACSAMALAIRNGTTYDPHTMATIAALAEQSASDDIRTQGHLLGLSAQQSLQGGASTANLAQSAQDFEARCQADGL